MKFWGDQGLVDGCYTSLIRPNRARFNFDLLPSDGRFDEFILGVENKRLAAAVAGPKTIQLAVHAFKAGEFRRERFKPGLGFVQRWNVFESGRPRLPDPLLHRRRGSS